MTLPRYLSDIKKYLTGRGISSNVDSVVILGSGLGGFSGSIADPISLPYHTIPKFPQTSIQGHSGELIYGFINNKKVLAFSGRFHHYEGHEFSTTVLPVRLAGIFNAKNIIVSNAAGAINTRFNVGDLMVIDGVFRLFHKISASPDKPFKCNLHGTADRILKIAAGTGIDVRRGTYLYVKGPNYETKAEIRAFRFLGADVVGMSTVPELTEASRLNIPAAAISLVTNMAAGITSQKLEHSEVKQAAETRKKDFSQLVTEMITCL